VGATPLDVVTGHALSSPAYPVRALFANSRSAKILGLCMRAFLVAKQPMNMTGCVVWPGRGGT
jgi:hypothetical protein